MRFQEMGATIMDIPHNRAATAASNTASSMATTVAVVEEEVTGSITAVAVVETSEVVVSVAVGEGPQEGATEVPTSMVATVSALDHHTVCLCLAFGHCNQSLRHKFATHCDVEKSDQCRMVGDAVSLGGWNGGGGGGYREEDPFAADNARKAEVDQIFAADNTGIDFDAYEDIPVEVQPSLTNPS
jgi:hypothetical protein